MCKMFKGGRKKFRTLRSRFTTIFKTLYTPLVIINSQCSNLNYLYFLGCESTILSTYLILFLLFLSPIIA